MKLTCSSCGERPAVSATLGLCEPCAYRRELGDAAVERQTSAANIEREARKAAKRAPGRSPKVSPQ